MCFDRKIVGMLCRSIHNGGKMTGIHTDPTLLDALKQAAGKKLTAEQLRRQKVSFIMGSLKQDSTITREFVESQLKQSEGQDA